MRTLSRDKLTRLPPGRRNPCSNQLAKLELGRLSATFAHHQDTRAIPIIPPMCVDDASVVARNTALHGKWFLRTPRSCSLPISPMRRLSRNLEHPTHRLETLGPLATQRPENWGAYQDDESRVRTFTANHGLPLHILARRATGCDILFPASMQAVLKSSRLASLVGVTAGTGGLNGGLGPVGWSSQVRVHKSGTSISSRSDWPSSQVSLLGTNIAFPIMLQCGLRCAKSSQSGLEWHARPA